MPNLEDRIIICGIGDAVRHVRGGSVGLLITASSPNISHEARDHGHAYDAEELEQIVTRYHIRHHKSWIFASDNPARYDPTGMQRLSPLEMRRAAEVTLKSFDKTVELIDPNKKILVHCITGRDRCGVVAFMVIYNDMKKRHEPQPVVAALAALHRQKPDLELVGVKRIVDFGEDLETADREIELFRDTQTQLNRLKERARDIGAPSVKELFATHATPETVGRHLNTVAERRKFLANCARYQMDLSVH